MKKIFIFLLSACMLICGCSKEDTGHFEASGDRERISDTDKANPEEAFDTLPLGIELSEDIKYSALVCDFSDSIAGVTPTVEFDKWNKEQYIDNTASQNISLVLNKKEVNGVYNNTATENGNDYLTHSYISEDGISFGIAADTNKMVYCFWGKPDQAKNQVLDQNACEDIAKDFLSKLVDVSPYTVTCKEKDGKFEFNFTKIINGIKTLDSATVIVTKDGSLYSFHSWMLGKIPTATNIEFDTEETDMAVAAKINSIYGNAFKNYDNVDLTVRSRSLTLIEGKQALQYYVNIDCIDILGEYESKIGGLIELIIFEN